MHIGEYINYKRKSLGYTQLQEYETAYLDGPDVGGFLIDSRDITSVIVNYYNKSKPIIECNTLGDRYGK